MPLDLKLRRCAPPDRWPCWPAPTHRTCTSHRQFPVPIEASGGLLTWPQRAWSPKYHAAIYWNHAREASWCVADIVYVLLIIGRKPARIIELYENVAVTVMLNAWRGELVQPDV